MIIRERSNDFVLIEQHDHANISGTVATHWIPSLFQGQSFRQSVEYAIFNHDIGWKPFDYEPFWDDKNQVPFSFISFPFHPKLILYTYGIDRVEKVDAYAALLCSYHYSSFIKKAKNKLGQTFVQKEKERQERLKKQVNFDSELFEFHYGLLQLCDNISLYICLNEPGTAKKDEHYFFKNGIPAHPALHLSDIMHGQWLDEKTIRLDNFPFTKEIEVLLKHKIIKKDTIHKNGFIQSYQNTKPQMSSIQIIGK